MKAAYKILTMCIVVSILLCSFSICTYAVNSGFDPAIETWWEYLIANNQYLTASSLPYGENSVVVQFKGSRNSNWAASYLFSGSTTLDNYENSTAWYSYLVDIEEVIEGITYHTYQIHLAINSLAPILFSNLRGNYTRVSGQTYNSSSLIYSLDVIVASFNGNRYSDGSLNNYEYYFRANKPMMAFGLAIDAANDLGGLVVGNGLLQSRYWEVMPYPDSISNALNVIYMYIKNLYDSDEEILSAMEEYYSAIDSQLSSLQSSINSMSNKIDSLSGGVTQVQQDISQAASQNQSAVSSAAAANSQAASQAADDIINAGDGSTINSDMSEVRGIVSKLNEWNSELNSFADSMDNSIEGVRNGLENGTTLFEKFVTAAPAGLTALIGFALVWFIARKIIGR